MKLTELEFMAMNNPIRKLIQQFVEIKKFRQLSNLKANKVVLEIGCGNGTGTKLIQKYFSPKKIYAVDIDEKMLKKAQKKNNDTNIIFEIADVTKLPYADNTFDAIFDFGMIHHIVEWKVCLKELKRVLKPNGELILEDLSIESFETFFGIFLKFFLKHPYEKMYKLKDFLKYLEKINFEIKNKKNLYPLGLVNFFVLIASKK